METRFFDANGKEQGRVVKREITTTWLASGSPSEIQVQKSSGREALDQAAVKAVKRWSFVPAKRGDKAEDGWVSVPIDFKLN
ncbi:energy transducer TonB, partial [Pseudomonas aeruginosa]|uniref:energy transducer TonB family protein n=1 Tax=Pseudomonas aeruginosa TaxID=287 RepID=UPI003014F850